MKKVIKKIGNILLVVVLIVVLFVSASLLISSFTPAGASIFGFHPMIVMSDSMEPNIHVGDMIIVQERDTSHLEVGEVISFFGSLDDQGEAEIITHRIAEVIPQSDGTVIYHTKGDNYELIDQHENNIFYQEPVTSDKIVGVWTGIHISNYKDLILYCLVIPVAIIFLWQLIVVIRLALKMHREKQVEMVQSEKDRVIEEYLREQKAKEEAAKAEAETASEIPETSESEDTSSEE